MSSVTTPNWFELHAKPVEFTMVIAGDSNHIWLKEMVQEAGGRVRFEVVVACNAMSITADRINQTKGMTYADFNETVAPYLECLTEEELGWMEKHSHQNTPYGSACRQVIFERLMIKKQ